MKVNDSLIHLSAKIIPRPNLQCSKKYLESVLNIISKLKQIINNFFRVKKLNEQLS